MALEANAVMALLLAIIVAALLKTLVRLLDGKRLRPTESRVVQNPDV